MWDGVSGVPGLGYHIRRSYHEENINTEWNDKQYSSIFSSLSNFRTSNHKCKHQLVYFCDSCGYGRDKSDIVIVLHVIVTSQPPLRMTIKQV